MLAGKMSLKYFVKNVLTIACSRLSNGGKYQNTQTFFEFFAIGDTLRSVGMCKIKIWTLCSFDIFSENLEKKHYFCNTKNSCNFCKNMHWCKKISVIILI